MKFPEVSLKLYSCKDCGNNEGIQGTRIEKHGIVAYRAVCPKCGAVGKLERCTDPALIQFVIAKSWNDEMKPEHYIFDYKRGKGKIV